MLISERPDLRNADLRTSRVEADIRLVQEIVRVFELRNDSACGTSVQQSLCSEVTVTLVSLSPFVSRRGLSNTNQRLSHVARRASDPTDD